MAEQILDREEVLPDGTVVEAKAFRVPRSPEYPEGIKYSFQHYAPESGETLLRYDNYNRHAGSRHHKHLREEMIVPLQFETLAQHFRQFLQEVRDR